MLISGILPSKKNFMTKQMNRFKILKKAITIIFYRTHLAELTEEKKNPENLAHQKIHTN